MKGKRVEDFCDTHQQIIEHCQEMRLDNINPECPICQDIEPGGCIWWGRKENPS